MDVDFIFSATFIAEDKYLHFILDANFGPRFRLGNRPYYSDLRSNGNNKGLK